VDVVAATVARDLRARGELRDVTPVEVYDHPRAPCPEVTGYHYLNAARLAE